MGVAIRLVCSLAVLTGVAGAPVAAQSAAADSGRTTLSGVYTARQATQGETVFQTVCGSCHTPSQFAGPVFQKQWGGRQVFSFFDQIRTAMPIDNPGGLPRADYLAVIAYIFKLNEYPEGTTDLPDNDDELKLIKFAVPPPGMQR